MNTCNLENSIASNVIFKECLSTSSNYMECLVSYYNIVVKTKLSKNKELYSEAKMIVLEKWDEICKFVIYVSEKTCLSIRSMIEFLKNPYIVKFLNCIKWSFAELYRIVKKGCRTWNIFLSVIKKYNSSRCDKKWDLKEYSEFEKWVVGHSKIKKLDSESIFGMMTYVWFNISFMEDIDLKIDMSDILMAFSGTYDMENIISSEDIINLVIAPCLLNLNVKFNFMYDKSEDLHFIITIINTLAKKFNIKYKDIEDSCKFDFEQQKKLMGLKNENRKKKNK